MTNIFKFPELRRKIIFTLGVIVIFRLLAHIPIPGVDVAAIREFLNGNAFFGLFDLFSGGGFQNFSLVTLGLGPYINASIILQLLTIVLPKLEEMQKEGETGREKLNMYTRMLSLPLTLIQAYGIYFLLSQQGVISPLGVFDLIVLVLSMTAGSMLLVWIGEIVTEHGIGNGISLLIFVGIISRLPASIISVVSTVTPENFINLLIFAAITVLIVVGVVKVNEGTRNIAIEYGRSGVASQKVSNFLPIKVNQAGVIPIIFAVSVVMVPSMLGGPLQATGKEFLSNLGTFFITNFSSTLVGYNVLYFLLVVAFTYFYTSVQFNPEKIADDVKKRGGFIPGVRPGKSTTKYLKSIVDRITLAGALFLALIAILPFIVQSIVGFSLVGVGGTGLLIVVSVVLETIRQTESLMVSRSYDRFLR